MENYNGIERRGTTPMEMQTSLLKLISKVESMDTNLETRLEAVKDKISNLDEKMTNRISLIEKQINVHCEDESEINDILDKHDKSIEASKNYIDRINNLEKRYSILSDRVNTLELEPVKKNAKMVTDFSKILRNAFYVSVSSGIVGFIVYFIIVYIRSK